MLCRRRKERQSQQCLFMHLTLAPDVVPNCELRNFFPLWRSLSQPNKNLRQKLPEVGRKEKPTSLATPPDIGNWLHLGPVTQPLRQQVILGLQSGNSECQPKLLLPPKSGSRAAFGSRGNLVRGITRVTTNNLNLGVPAQNADTPTWQQTMYMINFIKKTGPRRPDDDTAKPTEQNDDLKRPGAFISLRWPPDAWWRLQLCLCRPQVGDPFSSVTHQPRLGQPLACFPPCGASSVGQVRGRWLRLR